MKKIIKVLCVSILIGCYLVMLSTFMAAYNTDDKSIVVKINKYHEANFELIYLIISLPFVLWFSFDYINSLRNYEVKIR